MMGGEGRGNGSGGEREEGGGGGGRTPIQISPGHNLKTYCQNFANDYQFQ